MNNSGQTDKWPGGVLIALIIPPDDDAFNNSGKTGNAALTVLTIPLDDEAFKR